MKFRIIVIFSLVYLQTVVVFAHGDKPRLEISSDIISPGGVIEVRGVDFEFEELIVLTLSGSEIEIPFGEITADTDGVFLQIIMLPVDLKEGVYRFRAVTDDHKILSPPLLVQGPPLSDDANGGEGQRDQSDSLLVPIPTHPVSEVAVATPRVMLDPSPVIEDSSRKPLVVMSVAALVISVTIWIARTKRKVF